MPILLAAAQPDAFSCRSRAKKCRWAFSAGVAIQQERLDRIMDPILSIAFFNLLGVISLYAGAFKFEKFYL
jgi:hypothetical protein